MDFRIRQLQCFLTLSDLLNYGKTARALYMSQPTITFQIKSLEEAFGVKLFERDRQQVRLTDAGCAFREYAQSIMDTVDAAQECLGGAGYVADHGIERFYRDVRLFRIYEGSSEIQRLVISREMMKRGS